MSFVSLVVSFIKLCWQNKWLLPVLIVVGWSSFLLLRRRYRLRRQIAQWDLEKRRSAGIPDSDRRPWVVAYPAAEQKRRDEAEARWAKAQAEKKAAEEARRLEEKSREVDEWGTGVLKKLRRMQSSSQLTPRKPGRTDRRYNVADDLPDERPTPLGQYQSPGRRSPVKPLARRQSEHYQTPRLPSRSRRPAVKRGRDDTDSEEEEHDERTTRRRVRSARKNKAPEDIDMFSDMEEEDVEEGPSLRRKSSRKTKRDRDEIEEPRKRRRRFVVDHDFESRSDSSEPMDEDESPSQEGEEEVVIKSEPMEVEVVATPPRKAGTSIRENAGTPDGNPVFASVKPDFTGAKIRTNASGVRWISTTDGVDYRLAEAYIPKRKYVMPRDSQHPDARQETLELVKVWVDGDEYARLKAEGRLSWQKTPYEELLSQLNRTIDAVKQEVEEESNRTTDVNDAQPLRNVSRSTGRIGIDRSRPGSRPESPYSGIDSYLAKMSSPSRVGSPSVYTPRRPMSERARQKRYEELHALAGSFSSGQNSAAATAPSTPTPAEKDKPVASFSALGAAPATSSPLVQSSTAPSTLDKGKGKETAVPSISDPATTQPAPDTSEPAKATKPLFSFAPSKETEKPAEKAEAKPFFFAAPAVTTNDTAKPAEKDERSTGKSLFSFSSPASASDKAADAAISKPDAKPAPFSFSAAPTAPPTAQPTSSFSFGADKGAASEKPAGQPADKPADKPSFSFAPSTTAVPSAPTGGTDKPAFSFASSTPGGRAKPAETKSAFSFGTPSSNSPAPAPTEKPASFSFGSTSAAPPVVAGSETKSDKPAFSFGTPSASSSPAPAAPGEGKSDKPAFSFGNSAGSSPASTFAGAAPASADKPAFSFGTPSSTPAAGAPATSDSSAKSAFSFGTPTASTPTNGTSAPTDKSAGSFSFGSSSSSPAPGGGSSFSFGASSTTAKPAAFSFGNKPAQPSPLGAAPPANASSGNSTPASSTFSFGAAPAAGSASPAAGFAFGAAPVTSPGSPAPGSPAAGGFSFGTAGNTEGRTIKPLRRLNRP